MNDIRSEETVASTTVYQGKVVHVRRDEVRLANGNLGVREIIEHAPVVAMTPLDADGRLLLVRQFRKPVEQVLLEIPAGGVEPGESVEDAVRREMQEETGYTPQIIRPICSMYPSPGISTEVMHLFEVSDLTGDGVPTEPDDQLQIVRVSLSEAVAMVRRGEIVDAKSVVGILRIASSSSSHSC